MIWDMSGTSFTAGKVGKGSQGAPRGGDRDQHGVKTGRGQVEGNERGVEAVHTWGNTTPVGSQAMPAVDVLHAPQLAQGGDHICQPLWLLLHHNATQPSNKLLAEAVFKSQSPPGKKRGLSLLLGHSRLKVTLKTSVLDKSLKTLRFLWWMVLLARLQRSLWKCQRQRLC